MKHDETNPKADSGQGIPADLSRRDFFALAGSGLFVFIQVEDLAAFQEPERLPARQGYPTDFNAYMRIGADGRTTCFVGKVELGQGSKTALAQLLAEELDVAFDSVDMVMGDTDICPWDMGTFGSLSIRQFGPVLRAAGAEARAVLIQMAAEQAPGPRRPAPGEERYRHRSIEPWQECRLCAAGRREAHRAASREGAGKTGVRLHRRRAIGPAEGCAREGHGQGKIRRRHGASGDTACADRQTAGSWCDAEGHRHCPPPGKSTESASSKTVTSLPCSMSGPTWLKKRWGSSKAQFDRAQTGLDDKTIFDHLLKAAPQGRVVSESGNLAEGESLAATVIDETYLNSYVAHAAMETHSAVAMIEGGKATVWAGTQTPFAVKQQVAQALGFAPENVRVVTPYVGGGFGGKSASRQAVEAARLAKSWASPSRWCSTARRSFSTTPSGRRPSSRSDRA